MKSMAILGSYVLRWCSESSRHVQNSSPVWYSFVWLGEHRKQQRISNFPVHQFCFKLPGNRVNVQSNNEERIEWAFGWTRFVWISPPRSVCRVPCALPLRKPRWDILHMLIYCREYAAVRFSNATLLLPLPLPLARDTVCSGFSRNGGR